MLNRLTLHRSVHTLYICVTQEQYCVKFLLQSKLKFCKKSRIFLTKNSHFLSKRRFIADFRPIFAVFDNLKLFPVAFAVRSDSVRRPIRFRTPSDRIPYGGGGIFLEFMHKINSGLSGFTCCVVIGLNGS